MYIYVHIYAFIYERCIYTHTQTSTYTNNKSPDIYMYHKAYVSCFCVYAHKKLIYIFPLQKNISLCA